MFCISGSLAVPINPDKWSCTAFTKRGFGAKQFRLSKILTKFLIYKAGLSKYSEVSAVTLKPEASPTAHTDVRRNGSCWLEVRFLVNGLFVLNTCISLYSSLPWRYSQRILYKCCWLLNSPRMWHTVIYHAKHFLRDTPFMTYTQIRVA